MVDFFSYKTSVKPVLKMEKKKCVPVCVCLYNFPRHLINCYAASK